MDVIIGDLFSAVVLAMKPIITSNKVVLMAPMASNPNVFSGTKYLFSMTGSDNDYSYILSKYSIQVLKKTTLGNLYMMNDSGIDSDRLMAQWWEYLGGKVLARESFAPGATDYRTQLTKIRTANPEVLYISVSWREGANILRQLTEMNLKMQITANSSVKEPKLIELVGTAAEGVIFTDAYAGLQEEDKKVREGFEKRFNDRYKRAPGIVAYRTYDCARVVLEAMKRGGIKGDALRDTIVKLDIPGVSGHIRFREEGSPIRDAAMWTIKNGQFVELNYIGHAP